MSIPLFDCHCDTGFEAFKAGAALRRNALELDLARLGTYSPRAQVFAVCTASRESPCESANAVLAFIKSEILKNSDIASLCLNFHDIEQAVAAGKLAALISIEGAEQISSLKEAYDSGVRIVHPTWNFDNALCGAAMGSGSGLTAQGREFVADAQEMGVALDMSHISERAFWDVLEIAEKPVIAGHSDAKALCEHPRNLSDRQFCALVQLGGGAGINLYPDFLGLSRDVDAVIAHIEHFLSLGGERAVFLGCDLDGIDKTPEGISGVQDLGKIYEAMLRRNYPEALVRRVFWDNLYDIMRKML